MPSYLVQTSFAEDETCLGEATSADAVRIAAERAALAGARVAEAVTTARGESR
jgi:hypothetical protein